MIGNRHSRKSYQQLRARFIRKRSTICPIAHDFYDGPARLNVVGRKLDGIPKGLAGWMKRQAAIKPIIGHIKNDGRLGRNFLLGKLGDKLNALLCACVHNVQLMLRKMRLEGRPGRLAFAILSWLWYALVGVSERLANPVPP